MFLPVACLKCGKMFQVPEAAAGTDVACPWCKQSTAALPVAASTSSPPASDAPLSLDDAKPADVRRKRRRAAAEAPSTELRSGPPMLAKVAIAGIAALLALGATLVVLRYGAGGIPASAWSEFTAPDGSCSIHLPGTPAEEKEEPKADETVTRGMSRYTTTGWYSGAKVWLGWRDLDAGWVKAAKDDRDGAMTSPLLTGERDRRLNQVAGKVTKEATVRFGPNMGLEVWMDTPRGKLVERYIVVTDNARPRLYFFGIEAKNATAQGDSAQKLFNSFRANK